MLYQTTESSEKTRVTSIVPSTSSKFSSSKVVLIIIYLIFEAMCIFLKYLYSCPRAPLTADIISEKYA